MHSMLGGAFLLLSGIGVAGLTGGSTELDGAKVRGGQCTSVHYTVANSQCNTGSLLADCDDGCNDCWSDCTAVPGETSGGAPSAFGQIMDQQCGAAGSVFWTHPCRKNFLGFCICRTDLPATAGPHSCTRVLFSLVFCDT